MSLVRCAHVLPLPVLSDDGQRRISLLRDARNGLGGFWWLRCADDRYAWLDDPGLFCGNGLKGVAKRSAFVIGSDGKVAYVWMTEDPRVQVPFDEVRSAVQG